MSAHKKNECRNRDGEWCMLDAIKKKNGWMMVVQFNNDTISRQTEKNVLKKIMTFIIKIQFCVLLQANLYLHLDLVGKAFGQFSFSPSSS